MADKKVVAGESVRLRNDERQREGGGERERTEEGDERREGIGAKETYYRVKETY